MMSYHHHYVDSIPHARQTAETAILCYNGSFIKGGFVARPSRAWRNPALSDEIEARIEVIAARARLSELAAAALPQPPTDAFGWRDEHSRHDRAIAQHQARKQADYGPPENETP
jgi:hypothetical protein